ncbi:YhgE/Pip domain-containing protein [Cryobacterium psychrophilum]|uniref:YhgE/Pip domain-containing protein n=1 Tax=Cryobacterium psychrophilum TaxID=41988 RepID=A0A4Y8KPA1_9MICO|nr:YhgE/Pip domain-containing protein [Cryobacterium psychrophilum]TDW28597.1 putative membrane protein [Cryobacterium psychrophilum]TFD80407.1 YhgE/Pip domain-containing protein [Cryobacterium psychrophilum]
MKIFAMVRAELARLTSTAMSRIALIALLLVPVVYGGLYLWANQDPYAGLDRVPVALVVADTGAEKDGAPENYGDEVATQLVADADFEWHRVSAAKAHSGVTDSIYDFSVTIPADFSTAIVSAAGDSPHRATITLATNDTTGYLASTIGTQAAKSIRAAIVTKVNRQAADGFLLGLSDVRSSLVKATDGAGEVTDGAASAATGAEDLVSGAEQLSIGAHDLSSGLGTLNEATGTLATGAGQVDAGAASVAQGTGKVADATTSVAAGADRLATGTDQVATGAASLAAAQSALSGAVAGAGQSTADAASALLTARRSIAAQLDSDGLTPAQIDSVLATLDAPGARIDTAGTVLQSAGAQIDQLVAAGDQVSAGARASATGAATLADGAHETQVGAGQAADGANQTAAGAHTLATGAADVHTGAATAAEGGAKLDTGTAALNTGAGDLRTGLADLATGAATLRDGLQSGVDEIPASDPESRALQGTTIADPVDLNTAAVTSAGTYGAGLAPFFISLAGWIGIYALFLIVKPVSRRAITALHSPVKITLAGWLTPGLLGMVQMAVLFAIVAGALGFTVHNPGGTYAMMGLAALTFAAIILALNVWLGSVGQFIGLVLMVVQLVTAGGTFPWQTLPFPLDWLHHIMPMSYAVDGIRQLMYGGTPATAWADAGVLVLWLVGALVLTLVGVIRMTHFRTLRDLRPSLIG